MCKPQCLFSLPNLCAVDLSVHCLQIRVHTCTHKPAFIHRHANTARAPHAHWPALCIWCLSREGPREFELEMPWSQALGQCPWELSMSLLLCPWTVGQAFSLWCSTPEGLWWQVRSWGLFRSLQADLVREEKSRTNGDPCHSKGVHLHRHVGGAGISLCFGHDFL